MKSLYLVRHSKSSWKEEGMADMDRPLNKRGTDDAHLMGQVLAARGVQPALIVSSPAARAVCTALILAGELGYAPSAIRIEESLYKQPSPDWLGVIRTLPDDAGCVMVIGHDPSASETLSRLAGSRLESLPTTGLAAFECPVDRWKDLAPAGARLLYVDIPRNHRTVADNPGPAA